MTFAPTLVNLEVDSDGFQEMLDSHNQEMTIHELIEMHEIEQGIEELESIDSFQLGDQMTPGNWTERLSLIKKGLQILENTDSKAKRIFSTK
ncbi:tigger transposable element-derived protein 1 [Trichonephila clavipes]|nr:tigger transposable element-derived protein 1 [Trichonephila clavipes]